MSISRVINLEASVGKEVASRDGVYVARDLRVTVHRLRSGVPPAPPPPPPS